MSIEPKSCARCGTAFTPSSYNRGQQFCSVACRTEAQRAKAAQRRAEEEPSRNCKHCGTAFVRQGSSDRRVLYCSAACHAKAKREALRAKAAQRRADAGPQHCKQCGGPTEADTRLGGPRVYCGDECAREAKRAKERERYRETHAPRPTVSPDPCKWCGGVVEITTATGCPEYCSPACQYEARLRRTRERRAEARAAVPETSKPCVRCGTVIVRKGGDRGRQYCTVACQKEGSREDRQAKAAQRRAEEPRNCQHCGNEFPLTATGGAPRVYCSKSCQAEGQLKRKRLLYQLNKPQGPSVSPDPCKWCGGDVEATKTRGQPQYCSPACLYEARLRRTREHRAEARAAVPETSTPCVRCGTVIVRKGGDRARKYCTADCQKEAARDAKRARAAELRTDSESRPCKYCGEVFDLPANKMGKPAVYCSDQCRVLGARVRAKVHREKQQAAEAAP